MACKSVSKKAALITLWISIIIFVFSIVMIVVFPTIYNSVLKNEITLKEGSLLANIWKDIPLPIYEKLYFFNITNKEFFLNGSEAMNVTEVGPYTFNSRWVKKHPHWHTNHTVTYKEKRTYQFVPEMSNGTLEDEIYTLNGPMVIASQIAKDYPILLKALLSVLLGIEGENVIIRRTIRELAYEGYDDIIIKVAPLVKPDIPYKEGKFCWLYGKNATNDGEFTVFTGEDDASKTNFINNWNGQEKLSFWKGDTCNMINGTSLETGPPIVDNQKTYTFFQSIFCRSLTFNYTEDTSHFGIQSSRFRPMFDLFANSTENPDNRCYEVNKEHASGILDIAPCQFGAPVFISFPHFYLADPSYLDTVSGLSPNDEEHGSHIDVEKLTGVSIDASVKFQFNVEIAEVDGIFQLYNVPKGIFPILWVDLNLKIDEHFANFFKSHVNSPKIIAYSVLGVIAGVSLLLAVCCFVVICSCGPEEDDDDCLIDATDDIARIYKDEVTDKNCSDDDENLLNADTAVGEYSGLVNSRATDYGARNDVQSKQS